MTLKSEINKERVRQELHEKPLTDLELNRLRNLYRFGFLTSCSADERLIELGIVILDSRGNACLDKKFIQSLGIDIPGEDVWRI